jgi:hypothetical protein
MEWLNGIGIILSLAISASSLSLVFIWRKKDFQVTILKEQMNAYGDLLQNLFETSQEINTAYNDKVGKMVLEKGLNYSEEELSLHQTFVFVEFSKKYNESFNKFQKHIFLLPEDVIDATMEYYKYFSNLFENNNDSELGIKLLTEPNQKIYEVINAIRNHAAIDDITERTRTMLSKEQQLKFTE